MKEMIWDAPESVEEAENKIRSLITKEGLKGNTVCSLNNIIDSARVPLYDLSVPVFTEDFCSNSKFFSAWKRIMGEGQSPIICPKYFYGNCPYVIENLKCISIRNDMSLNYDTIILEKVEAEVRIFNHTHMLIEEVHLQDFNDRFEVIFVSSHTSTSFR